MTAAEVNFELQGRRDPSHFYDVSVVSAAITAAGRTAA